ncbi:hypothetical protein HETIRDRAFT_117307 [Heterobasidion irregulare TC 32-1]|uniref:Uncharacterized protein n=1 Tax=Heterobasidion irregulare (strain TC 32-1) TaxID=747525 RepID=W4K1B7_HETIT|nr:uncharacterized protein HETIRDRAFT_117307 [Heterobasidion irregulare TC 32-1]ETW79514.1 hypothetical protein HETIRDRAFT_117307 [Heterobasidion irregulare TC 32-1]
MSRRMARREVFLRLCAFTIEAPTDFEVEVTLNLQEMPQGCHGLQDRARQIPIAMVHESPRGRERAIFAIAGHVGLVDTATKQDHTEAKKKAKNILAETRKCKDTYSEPQWWRGNVPKEPRYQNAFADEFAGVGALETTTSHSKGLFPPSQKIVPTVKNGLSEATHVVQARVSSVDCTVIKVEQVIIKEPRPQIKTE